MIKQLNPSTYVQNFEDWEIEIGDVMQSTFLPQVKVKKWGNEINFSQRLINFGAGSHDFDNGVANWFGLGSNCTFQDKDKGLQFLVTLTQKPLTNDVRFSLEAKGVKIFKQDDPSGLPGAIQTTNDLGIEGILFEEEGHEGFMPLNVINSYAFYHESKTNNKYKTGKAFHLYRPRITDDLGVAAWCDQDINLPLKLLTITIPQSFLDNAVYPIVLE